MTTAARTSAEPVLESTAARHAALDTHRHLAVLDGLRGTAAYCVLMFHSVGNLGLFANGYLMVDLFFLLSGFVIAYSYEDRLRAGLALREFAIRRVCRLYPMIFLGAIVSTVVAFLSVRLRHTSGMDLHTATVGSILSFVPFPDVMAGGDMDIFPTNTVLWSLFFEIVVNAAYACGLRRLGSAPLGGLVLASLALVAVGGLGGNLASNVWWGFPRVAAGFFGGVLLFRWWRRRAGAPPLTLGLLPGSLIIMLVAIIPAPIGKLLFLPVYALFALVVLLAAGARTGEREARLCTLLAALSYPVYILHRPIVMSLNFILRRLIGPGTGGQIAAALLCVVLVTGLSILIVRFYEDPLRRRLMAMLMPRPRIAGLGG